MCFKKIVSLWKITSMKLPPAKVPEVKCFRKISTSFKKQGKKLKLITSVSYLKNFFCVFSFFFKCFLSTYFFDLDKLGLKWKDMKSSCNFSKNKSGKFVQNQTMMKLKIMVGQEEPVPHFINIKAEYFWRKKKTEKSLQLRQPMSKSL